MAFSVDGVLFLLFTIDTRPITRGMDRAVNFVLDALEEELCARTNMWLVRNSFGDQKLEAFDDLEMLQHQYF